VTSLLDPEFDARLGDAGRRGVAEGVVREAQSLRDALRVLAEEADVAAHVARLEALLARLGIGERHLTESHVVMASASYDPGAQSILRAIARDEAAVRGMLSLLAELCAHADDAPPGELRVSVAHFAEMLADAAAAQTMAPSTSAARGVLVAPARALVGRSVRALAVVGLNDGGFPAHSQDDGPLGEVERRAVLRASGRLLARTGGREEETLLFLATVSCATECLALSGARHDAGGRALPPSPFMVDARRAIGAVPQWAGRDPLARSQAVPPRGPERASRAWIQLPLAPPPMLQPGIESARVRAAIETERREFFAGRRPEPGRYSGRVDHDPAVVDALDLRGYGSARRPVDVTTLERAARCGFRAFSQEVLGLQAPVEPTVTIDSKERGHLLHALVEAGQLALREGRGSGSEALLARVSTALDEAGARFSAKVPHADRDLLRADLLAIRRQVETWLRRRMDAQERWEMLETEVAFGPRRQWPALEIPVAGEEDIVIKGRIDGVERMDGEVRVVEFKSGRGAGFRKRLREGVLDTQFQLVVYAAALARAHRAGAIDAQGAVDGVYVGFRDQSEHGLREVLSRAKRCGTEAVLDVDTVVSKGAEGQGELAHAVRRAILPVRQGVFAPRPRDCDFCDAGSLCRIERHEGGGDE
jgi:ATP-dependent helicase/nuclease subunit B